MPITIYGDGYVTGLANVTTSGSITTTSGNVVTNAVQFGDASVQTTALAGIGYNQTWQDMIGSRALATNYTNNTGKPIMVMVLCHSNTANGIGVQITVNGVIAAEGRDDASGYGPSLNTIVPPGAVYRADINLFSGALVKWSELR